MKKRIVGKLVLFLTLGVCMVLTTAPAEAGTLKFHANGEELIAAGFRAPEMTKDGWALTFTHAFVVLSEITAYQTDPPYEAESGKPIAAEKKAVLDGVHVVDLAMGAEDDPSVFVGEVANAPAGHYNAVSWKMAPGREGALAGYSMFLVGTAEKDGKTVPFQIRTAEASTYRCGEFVGDERKGFLVKGKEADLEMTVHFDHVFGRADKSPDDPLNKTALGFAPFADSTKVHDIQLRGLHIGHAGEGHCGVEWH